MKVLRVELGGAAKILAASWLFVSHQFLSCLLLKMEMCLFVCVRPSGCIKESVEKSKWGRDALSPPPPQTKNVVCYVNSLCSRLF